MHIKNLTQLSVIEMPYGDLNWGPDPRHIRQGIYSDIQLWDKYRELDDYHLCSVYNKANVPVQTQRITYQPVEKEEIYLTLTRQSVRRSIPVSIRQFCSASYRRIL